MGVDGDVVDDDVDEEAVTVLRVVLVGPLEIDTDDVDDEVEPLPPPPSSVPQVAPKSPVLLNASDDWPDVMSNLVV